jgi:serine/threonine-protein kinase HipA
VLPAKGQGGDWYVKLPDELPDVPETEYAVMTWARDSGITVPEFDVFTRDQVDLDPRFFDRGALAFGIRRFDRPAPGVRVHIEDFAQVNGIHPFNKYDDEPEPRDIHTRINYETLARQILSLCGEADLREYIRRLVFMTLSGNADAHLKNWSLIYPDGRKPRLSPVYDQVATIAYPDVESSAFALPFANSLTFESMSVAGFERLATILHRDPEEMARWVTEDVTRMMDTRHAALGPLPPDQRYWLDKHHSSLKSAPGSLLGKPRP